MVCSLARWLGFFLLATNLLAQTTGSAANPPGEPIAATPNRPTVSNPAELTQYGVLEMEYGWTRIWPGAGSRENTLDGLLKFGLLRSLELRWATGNLISLTDTAGTRQGVGDNWIGAKYQFARQSGHIPTMAFSYALKLPSASEAKGLGSGRLDHAFALLASKDIGRWHGDFNFSALLAGHPEASGFDRNVQWALAVSHSITNACQITGEVYQNTRLNAENPGFAATLWAVSYKIKPRLVLDGGIDVGFTAFAPRKRVFAGFTYAIANLYSRRTRHERTPP